MSKKIFFVLLLFLKAQPLFSQKTEEQLDTLLTTATKAGEFQGTVLIARQGKIILEKGYGDRDLQTHLPNTGHTIFQIASVTKTFTATLILKLAELGKLSLEDKLNKYYPDYPNGENIKIKNLLNHTSGIPDYTNDAQFMLKSATMPATQQQMFALFKNKKPDFAPGSNWKYSNSAYSILGYIIEKATGLSYEKAIKTYIFTPLGMKESGFDFAHLNQKEKSVGYVAESPLVYTKRAALVDSSVSFSAGAIYSTVKDLYKWHQGLQQNLIVSKTSMEQAYIPYLNHYGYGWEIDSIYNKQVVSHSGAISGFRSNFVRIISDDICIVMLCNTESPALKKLSKKVLAILYNQRSKTNAIRLSESLLKKYTGSYQINERDMKFTLSIQNGELFAEPDRGPGAVLLAKDETHFFRKDEEDFVLRFLSGTNGQTEGIEITFKGKKMTGKKIN